MQTTKFDYLVIVASGLGTRMQQYTLNNYLPKSLVSLGNETILDAQLKDAHELANKVVIICRNEHSAMYEDICRLKNYQNVQLIEYSLADGTFNTIQYALKMLSEFYNLTDKQSALFVWSDIICKHKNTNTLKTLTKLNSFNANKQLQVTIGLDSNKIHRFLYNANAITEVSDAKGNIVGVYATNNAKCLLKSMSKYDFTNKDFVQYVQKASKDNELHMTAIKGLTFVDVGDTDKYVKFMSNVDVKQRYFNDIKEFDNMVAKSSNCDKGFSIMTDEIKHYKVCKEFGVFANVIDSVVDNDNNKAMILLEKMQQTVHEHISSAEDANYAAINMFDRFANTIQNLHNVQGDFSKNEIQSAMFTEYVNVTYDRYKSIRHILDFNDFSERFDNAITRLAAFFTDKATEFTLIHGDTNTANVMLNAKGELKLIDPRGYFGSVKHYGDPAYDIAKFAYGLTGYTHFNNDTNFTATFENGKLQYDIKSFANLDELTSNTYIKLLVGVIWLKLPAYIINNPLKSLCAFDIGLRMTDQYLQELGY